MGCNIADIDLIVQWKLPSSVSSFVQRAGRTARGPGRTGTAILLVEPSAYQSSLIQAHITQEKAAEKTKKNRGIRVNPEYPKSSEDGYAAERGQLRGSETKADKMITSTYEVPIDFHAIDEGLYAFIQTIICRRRVLQLIYSNDQQPVLLAPCCDLCVPELLDRARAPSSGPLVTTRKSAIKIGICHEPTASALREWRKEIRTRDFTYALFPSSGILSDSAINSLSSVGPILSLIRLEEVLGGWEWFGKYGNQLIDSLKSLVIPAMVPKPPVPRTAKRPVDNEGREMVAAKRARVAQPVTANQISPTAMTSVNPPASISGVPPQTPQRLTQQAAAPAVSQILPGNPYAAYLTLGSSPYYRQLPPSSSSPAYPSQHYYPRQYIPATPSQPPQQARTQPDAPKPHLGGPSASSQP